MTYLTWFKAHEKLLLFVLAAALVCYVWGSALKAWVNHDQRVATASDTASKQAQDALQKQTETTNALNARIDQMMQQRAVDTQKQKRIDAAAQVAQVGARITDLLKIKPEEIIASPVDNTLVLSNAAAHADVASLEDLKAANLDVLDLSTKLGACNVLSDQREITLGAEHKAHVDDVNLERAKSKTAFWRGFKWGVVTGFIGGVAAHFT